MKLGERVKILRDDQRLSQGAFGARLGVSRSVINNLEHCVLANESAKLPLIKLMSKEFSVSEEWLLRGDTTQIEYLPERGTALRGKLESYGADAFEIEMIRAYLQLDYIQREIMLRTFQDLLNQANTIVARVHKSERPEQTARAKE